MAAENANPPPTMEQMRTNFEEFETLMAETKDQGPALNLLDRPPVRHYQNCGWGGRFDANNFELKLSLISMVQSEQFGGRPTEDANAHLSVFLDICDTIKINGMPNDVIRLRMFWFSLRERAKEWYKTLNREEITTWEKMCEEFLSKYFPPSKDQRIVSEINHFNQFSDENIYEAWERYRELQRRCPQHGFSE